MKRFGMILLVMSLLVSCKDETTYQTQILIKNETNSILTIKLFPKREYMSSDLYNFSGIGSGYRETEFQLDIDSEIELYISEDLNKKPHIIAAQVFDSIHVILSNETKTTFKFSSDTVIGYSENLYSDDSVWNYEIRNFNLPTNFHLNPVESNDYIFIISQDKY